MCGTFQSVFFYIYSLHPHHIFTAKYRIPMPKSSKSEIINAQVRCGH